MHPFFKKIVSLFKNKDVYDFWKGILLFGLMINYSFAVIFGIPFEIYTFPAWGIMFYLFRFELIYFIKGVRS